MNPQKDLKAKLERPDFLKEPFIQGGSSATGEAMGYIAVPGSNTDLYSGTILSSQTGTAEGVDGVLLGKLCIQ